MNYIDIPNAYRLQKNIPTDKFDSAEIIECVDRITWCGNIKPAISGVEESLTDKIRYEEIQLFHCEMRRRDLIYDIGRIIYAKIKYPCIIEFQIGNATTIGVCTFQAGKKDREKNVLHSIIFSHWLHEDILSPQAQKMIDRINDALRKKADMADIYGTARGAVLNWKMGGTSRAHVDRIIYDLVGKGKVSPEEVRRYCQPFEFHARLQGSNKYTSQRKAANYTFVHDYEEIWYSLMKCPETKRVIEGRRYRDMDDLLFSIDSKGW